MSKAQSINPYNGEVIAEYDRISEEEVQQKLEKSQHAFREWSQTSFEERKKYMLKAADLFEERLTDYAQLITKEMGKIIGQAEAEIKKCALICRYYANQAEDLLSDEMVETEAQKSYVTFQPSGVILAVMPWNFPFYQVIRCIVPALMAGNTCVLKHASNVQGAAFELEKLMVDAGFPTGAFYNLNVSSDQVKYIIKHKAVAGIALTGSEPAGRSVASIAGGELKKCVLELGGSDAYVILDDADMEEAVDLATFGRLQNNGQTCIAAKRFVVLESIYDEFLAKYRKKMSEVKMGDPMEESTYYGPMARLDLRDEIHEQVEKSIEQGARLILGGEVPQGQGAFYPATILADLEPGMEAFDQELFGPVASVIKAKDIDHAIELANATDFGLGSGVFCGDPKQGERIALNLQAGSSFVNKLTVSDPRMPFGGVKNSGFGRELSDYGIKEFTNIKSIWIK